MVKQLVLIPVAKDWELDAKTKASGRRGIAEARKMLAAHKPEEITP